jgi:outer membrane protein assembly factor BamD (BamD/ComL family)
MSKYSDTDKMLNLLDYTQWKSDSWRNAAIDLYESIKSKNQDSINNAVSHFEEIRKQFPYSEV